MFNVRLLQHPALPIFDNITQRPNILLRTVLAILFNCSEPESITKALDDIQGDTALTTLLNESGIVLGAYANRLTAVDPNWTLAESEGPQPFRKDLDEQQYWDDFVSKSGRTRDWAANGKTSTQDPKCLQRPALRS